MFRVSTRVFAPAAAVAVAGAAVGGTPSLTAEDLRAFWADALSSDVSPRLGVGAPFTLDSWRVAKASPDECFAGVGVAYPPLVDGDCLGLGSPKVNAAYTWGLTKTGEKLYWGTGPNIHCLVIGGFLGATTPIETGSYVCEFGESQFVQTTPGVPAAIGDFRPPSAYVYDLGAETLTDLTPTILAEGLPTDAFLLQTTTGLRSAGSTPEVVFLAGPSLFGDGINVFAFDAQSDEFLGAAQLGEYTNIRQWLYTGGELYTAVRNAPSPEPVHAELDGEPGGEPGGGCSLPPLGSVLKWVGDAADPFVFEVVGDLPAEGANLATFNDRLAVSTWPAGISASGVVGTAGVLVSPPVAAVGGLTESDRGEWNCVWRATDYEPDPLVAQTYGGGDLAQHGEYLVWGTMHVPGLSAVAWAAAHGDGATDEELLVATLGGYRAVSIFRGAYCLDGNWRTDLLYGQAALPAYDPFAGTWSIEPTGNGFPLFGPSGFGVLTNNYTWTMQVYDGRLFVGTMDFAYLVLDALFAAASEPTPAMTDGVTMSDVPTPAEASAEAMLLGVQGVAFPGADLYRFDTPGEPAVPERLGGVGNYTSYGIRTMVADETGLYLGMANPMNLLTATNDFVPEGGWEVIRMTPRCPGDCNFDGVVDGADLLRVINGCGNYCTTGPAGGDANYSSFVNGGDLCLVVSHFGNACD